MPSPVVNAQSVLKVLRTFRERQATASPMSAKEWADVPVEIRDGAFWSAKLEHAQHVAELKRTALQALRGARVRVGALRRGRELTGDEADETVLMSKGQIISEMRAAALERGLEPTGPRPMEDIASAQRIGLIVDMAEKMTYGKARFESGNDPAVLDVFPAQELVRIEPRKEPRDWETRWQEAGAAVGWEGASQARMVALKSSPIWAELSEFGLPYPPFDYGSGMGVRDVERAVAVELGLMADDDEAQAAEAPDETRGNVKGLDETEREWLLEQFRDRLGDAVSIEGDEVVFRRKDLKNSFDPNQPRDELGRWSDDSFTRFKAITPDSDTNSWPVEKLFTGEGVKRELARAMKGVKIKRLTQSPYGSKTAHYDSNSDTIFMPSDFSEKDHFKFVVAHEIGHARQKKAGMSGSTKDLEEENRRWLESIGIARPENLHEAPTSHKLYSR